MKIEKAFRVLNALKRRGLVKEYAIGGGMASLFYIEPFLTYDLDVFVFLPAAEGILEDISPIYEYLRNEGYEVRREHVIIEEVPVQFIPAYNDLLEEAVKEAIGIVYKGIRTRVVRAEHLLVIMLQTYRPKDRVRITPMLDQAEIDSGYLDEILRRHRLKKEWLEFRRRYYGK
jgi:hypothetical protein